METKINPCRHCKHTPGISNPTVTEYKLRCFNPECYQIHGENSVTLTSQMATINAWNYVNPEQQEEEMVLYKAKWPRWDSEADALQSQVGGDHYKKLGEYQPWSVLPKWLSPDELLGFAKGEAIVYLMRNKNGREDIEKAAHVLRLYLEATKP